MSLLIEVLGVTSIRQMRTEIIPDIDIPVITRKEYFSACGPVCPLPPPVDQVFLNAGRGRQGASKT